MMISNPEMLAGQREVMVAFVTTTTGVKTAL
jgi:hypothetical protein